MKSEIVITEGRAEIVLVAESEFEKDLIKKTNIKQINHKAKVLTDEEVELNRSSAYEYLKL